MRYFILLLTVLFCLNGYSQELGYFQPNSFSTVEELPTIYINKGVVHFRSPEDIEFIDISTDVLVGDLPISNLAMFKLAKDSIHQEGEELAVVTIVGKTFMAQYKVVYSSLANAMTQKAIIPNEMQPLEFPEITLTNSELKMYCMRVIKNKRRFFSVRDKDMKLKMFLNNIYAWGDFIFVDVTVNNYTNLKYDIDMVNFVIQDKKIYKETNVQRIEVEPIYNLYNQNKTFKKSFRNVFVFKKFTYPNDKVLRITYYEKQISGRTISLDINYSYLLNADTF